MSRWAALALLCAIAGGCATVRPWINTPLQTGGPVIDEMSIAARDPSALIAVTLSGGGARAAAFGLGVLQELRATGCCWNDRTSNLLSAVDLLLFGTGNHASQETEGYLSDVARRWEQDVREGRRDRFPGFARDAEIFLVHANLRDAPENAQRHQLLQVPTAFSISDDEVTHLIAAGRAILRASPQFQALRKSLGLAPAP